MLQGLSDYTSKLVQVMTVRQQAVTLASVDSDLCRHMASLCHNELIQVLMRCRSKGVDKGVYLRPV